jgi:hypothetical protein
LESGLDGDRLFCCRLLRIICFRAGPSALVTVSRGRGVTVLRDGFRSAKPYHLTLIAINTV